MNENDFSYYQLYIDNWEFTGTLAHCYRPLDILTLFCDLDVDPNNNHTVYTCSAEIMLTRLNILGINETTISNDTNLQGYELEDIITTFNQLKHYELDNIDEIELQIESKKLKRTPFFDDYTSFDDFKQFKLNSIDIKTYLYILLSRIKNITTISIEFPYYKYTNNIKKLPHYILSKQLQKSVYLNKTIILTEGNTDILIIKQALNLLHPKLAHLYSFFDFNNLNIMGGSGTFKEKIKVLIAAGFSNRMILILDNDITGNQDFKDLIKMKLPDNFRVIVLPNIDIANNFKVKGLNDKTFLNVNNLAVSIEFFCGKDVLLDKTSSYVEIHETNGNYNNGKLHPKRKIMKEYEKKIKVVKKKNNINEYDWTELQSLFDKIFNAFN